MDAVENTLNTAHDAVPDARNRVVDMVTLYHSFLLFIAGTYAVAWIVAGVFGVHLHIVYSAFVATAAAVPVSLAGSLIVERLARKIYVETRAGAVGPKAFRVPRATGLLTVYASIPVISVAAKASAYAIFFAAVLATTTYFLYTEIVKAYLEAARER